MARIREDQMLVPSVLDRLIDDDPHTQQEPAKSRNQVLRELKLSVRRDLENLLNTRWRCVAWPPDLNELETSLVNYGIPDFTGTAFASSSDQEQFRKTVEAVIRRFEPRFKRVRVELLTDGESLERSLKFRIDALLYAEPAPEPVVFDTEVETATGTFEVKGTAR
jgi:type VI secretion system protein ImpF